MAREMLLQTPSGHEVTREVFYIQLRDSVTVHSSDSAHGENRTCAFIDDPSRSGAGGQQIIL